MNISATNLANARTTQAARGGPCRRNTVMRSPGKAREGGVWPIRPAAPPADIEGAIAALARRNPAACGPETEVVLGGPRLPRIGAFRTRRAVIIGIAADPTTYAPGASRPHAAGFESPGSALLAAAITRAGGSLCSKASASRRPAPTPSLPGDSTPAAPTTALTPLEQAVHDLVEQGSSPRRPRKR